MNLTSSAPTSASSSLRFPSTRPPDPRWRHARAAPPSSREDFRSRLVENSLSLDSDDASGSAHHSRSVSGPAAAPNRLRRLASEFRSLAEPIDRVKRLLHYAEILPPFDESARLDANRVPGCATRVWLEVGTYGGGGRGRRMRFRADSDSEISKGFCSCLIWALDEAEPEEVIAVRAEDLAAINVGLVAHSRANTWQNVLTSMQKRTEALIREGSTEPDREQQGPAEVNRRCSSPNSARCQCQKEA
ncbi:sufE-like protein 2, chloroplastic [Rhodamnia argentea]|uniref:SufE-like protein 2, chloroplastic n=1 Tax=Rhodamnia argentea TaxID=178133 RepID=A0ABM3HGE9_9MYRT|nr:sufE-like protein 2, chloroplastic [Rhodamnia argentea]